MAVTQIAGWFPVRPVFAHKSQEVRRLKKWDRANLAYVGMDTHKEQHSAVMLDCFGDRLGSLEVQNRPGAFPAFLEAVQALAPAKHLLFGLENTTTWGRELTRFLLEHGQTVLDVAPIRTDRKRKRQPHPDKSDERDALAIAKTLMQDLVELPLSSSDDLLWTLSLVLGHREGLVRERTRVKNRLHALLPYAYPDYARFFAEPFGKTALAFWERYPSPPALTDANVAKLAAFLRAESNYFSRAKAAEILELVAASGVVREFQPERDEVLREQVRQLRNLGAAIGRSERQLEQLVRLTGQRLDTLPGVSTVIAAELLVGIGDVNRFATPDKLAKYAGIAPKQWSSAGQGEKTRSEHGRRSLHSTFYHIALIHVCVNKNGTVRCAQSRAYYEKKLQEGKKKKAAMICLMRVLVRIVWRMMKHREPYWKLIGQEVA